MSTVCKINHLNTYRIYLKKNILILLFLLHNMIFNISICIPKSFNETSKVETLL